MNSVVDFCNALTGWIVSAALWPVSWLSLDYQLIWISILAGIAFLLIYGAVSSQGRIRAIKRSIHAALLEVVLFRHDLPTSLKAQGRLFAGGAAYFLIAVPPILVLLVPCLFLLSQLNLRFGYRPVEIGEHVLVKAKVENRRMLYKTVLEVPQGIEATSALRIPETQEVMWRLKAAHASSGNINIKLGDSGASLSQPFAVGKASPSIATHLYREWWWRVLYPDTSLDAVNDAISFLSIDYPEQNLSLLGLQMHWVFIFAIVSILAGIVASRLFGVEI